MCFLPNFDFIFQFVESLNHRKKVILTESRESLFNAADDKKPLVTIPYASGEVLEIYDDYCELLQKKFPELYVLEELKDIERYLTLMSSRRPKTVFGMRNFIVKWLIYACRRRNWKSGIKSNNKDMEFSADDY